jgi:hypothetical protein
LGYNAESQGQPKQICHRLSKKLLNLDNERGRKKLRPLWLSPWTALLVAKELPEKPTAYNKRQTFAGTCD